MTKYLVFGSKGTLGTEFSRLLSPYETISLSKNEVNVTDVDAVQSVVERYQPQIVINCTAFTNVDLAETEYDQALAINGTAVANIARACTASGSLLIHFSTGMVFEGNEPNGYNESSPTAPVNRYGESKLAGESQIRALSERYHIIRTEWLYGQPQTYTAKKSFIELMIELGKNGTVKAVNNEFGQPTWAKDLAVATLELIHAEKPNGVYHLANEGIASRLDWVKEIYAILNMPVEVVPVAAASFPRTAHRPHYEILNNTKLPKLRSWQSALQEYLSKI